MTLGRHGREGPSPAFGGDFLAFVDPEADRLVRLFGLLAQRGLEGRVLSLGGRRHVLVRARGGRPRILLVAHYDRVEGSPGALDNSAGCLVLAEAARRIAGGEGEGGGVLALFTDGEEAAATGGPLSQGAYALGRGLDSILRHSRPSVLVLDVVGRGDRLLRSTAVEETVAKAGPRAAAAFGRTSERISKAARAAGFAEPLGLPLPWSDDLGFTLAGLPAHGLSLLPAGEAKAYAEAAEGGGPRPGPADPAWPPTWARLHGPADDLPLLEAGSIAAMTDFCVAFCRLGD